MFAVNILCWILRKYCKVLNPCIPPRWWAVTVFLQTWCSGWRTKDQSLFYQSSDFCFSQSENHLRAFHRSSVWVFRSHFLPPDLSHIKTRWLRAAVMADLSSICRQDLCSSAIATAAFMVTSLPNSLFFSGSVPGYGALEEALLTSGFGFDSDMISWETSYRQLCVLLIPTATIPEFECQSTDKIKTWKTAFTKLEKIWFIIIVTILSGGHNKNKMCKKWSKIFLLVYPKL